MNINSTEIADVKIVEPDVFPDERGLFFESYTKEKFHSHGITDDFIQDNESYSRQYVLRGLHFQKIPHTQGKLVSVFQGEVYDVAVDIRPDSPTYKKWIGVTLSEENHRMLYVPAGLAHGFLVLSPTAHFHYKMSGGYYNKEAATGIRWNDATIGVEWPLPPGVSPILSTQDANLPEFEEV